MPKLKLLEWSPRWDLSTIPWDLMVTAYSRQRGARAVNPGRKRSCGHSGKWVQSCEVCIKNYTRTQRRIANAARESAT